MSLYWKRDLGQVSESNLKEILTTQSTLNWLSKELKEVIRKATRQKKLRDERKRKLESMSKVTHIKLLGKATSDLGQPEKCDKSELVKTICWITISGSATLDSKESESANGSFELQRIWIETTCSLPSFVAPKP